jgi:hypothetical protein
MIMRKPRPRSSGQNRRRPVAPRAVPHDHPDEAETPRCPDAPPGPLINVSGPTAAHDPVVDPEPMIMQNQHPPNPARPRSAATRCRGDTARRSPFRTWLLADLPIRRRLDGLAHVEGGPLRGIAGRVGGALINTWGPATAHDPAAGPKPVIMTDQHPTRSRPGGPPPAAGGDPSPGGRHITGDLPRSRGTHLPGTPPGSLINPSGPTAARDPAAAPEPMIMTKPTPDPVPADHRPRSTATRRPGRYRADDPLRAIR